jgi:Holliday junction resolvase RusA-like endonuclease
MFHQKKIIIKSPPQAQGRPRFCTRGAHAFAFDPHKDKKNWTKIQLAEQCEECLKCPLILCVTFYLPIPKSASKKKKVLMISNEIKHTKKPDVDNLLKFILDAMNNIVFVDDSQIWNITTIKKYSEESRTEIDIHWFKPTLIS